MSLTKPWSEHLKANIVPILSMIGSLIWFGHILDSTAIGMKNDISQIKESQSKTDIKLNDISDRQGKSDIKLNEFYTEFKEYKMQQDYKYKLDSVKRLSNKFVTERHMSGGHTIKDLAVIVAK